MNETAKRRKRLLEQTRELYQDNKANPAVHPRYKAAYHQIYGEDVMFGKSTIGLRLGISILLFAVFVAMKQNGIELLGVDDLQILDIIAHNFQIKLY